jgi:hypothetical protein
VWFFLEKDNEKIYPFGPFVYRSTGLHRLLIAAREARWGSIKKSRRGGMLVNAWFVTEVGCDTGQG